MKVSSLWLVTKPTPRSVMADICFRVELPLDLYHQFMGGLKPDEIIAFYDDRSSAEQKAKHELHKVKRQQMKGTQL